MSIGAIGGNAAAQNLNQAARHVGKRGVSHERGGGKGQRPRSSKGYRGNLQAPSHNTSTGGPSSNQMPGLDPARANASSHASAQKFQSTKSEERALKTSQNQRSLVAKNPR